MRLRRETALVVCLCLWIPVAQSYAAPEDQDGSGDDDEFSGSWSGDDDEFSGSGDDDEFSGSGSGDDGIWPVIEPEVTTLANPDTTKMAWFTDAPVGLPEHSVTQFFTFDNESEAPGHITDAPLPHTTQITETQPYPVIKSFGSEKDQKVETTTISEVAQQVTTVPPAVKPPVVPTHVEEYTTTPYSEDNNGESSVVDQDEDETTVLVETVTTGAPEMETTPLLLTTTLASNLADTEASGDAVESTTVQVIFGNDIEKNIIPEKRDPNLEKPAMNDDFKFENEIPKSELPGSESDFARGGASDNDSLLERKEVLAGVIAGGVVGLAFAIMLVTLMVYRMKKKDEGSYSLDEHKHPNGGYQKPQKQEEFLA